MVDNIKKFKPDAEPEKPAIPDDAQDIARLFETGLGDAITEDKHLNIAIGKPKDFFRTHPSAAYRPRAQIYIHSPEGVIEKQYFIVDPAMKDRIDEARNCTLVTVIDRVGNPRLWPIPMPKEGERDMVAWQTARGVAREGMDRWVRAVWVRRAYIPRLAQPGYAPDPDWTKVKPFLELVRIAFGEHGIIKDEDHFIYRELFGVAPESGDDDI
jgi:hypothetical protein